MFIRILQVTGLKNFPTAIITDKRVDACFRTLCFKLKFLAYKKRQTHEKKSPIFFSTFFLCNFSVWSLQCFLLLLPTKSWKSRLPKLLIVGPNLLFPSLAQPTAQSPELIFHIIKCPEQASVLLSVTIINCFPGSIWIKKLCQQRSYQFTAYGLESPAWINLELFLKTIFDPPLPGKHIM